MKKTITLCALFVSVQTFATDTFSCTASSNSKFSYYLNKIDNEHYVLSVTKLELVPWSCQSRWGCDYIEKVIFNDNLDFIDTQGGFVFKSKRTYIEIDDLENAKYSYTYKDIDGTFKRKTFNLKCR